MTELHDPDRIRREIERTQDGLARDVGLLTDKVTPTKIAKRRADRARATARRWKDAVMGSAPASAASSAADRAHDATQSVAATMHEAPGAAAETAGEIPRRVREHTEGNPLAAAVLAFGAGWLISSLLPVTEREKRVGARAADLAEPLVERAGQVASEVKGQLGPPTDDAVESVRSVAGEAGRVVTDEARAATASVRDRAQDAIDDVQPHTTGHR